MLRHTLKRLSGFDVKELYPHGVPKRTFPYREHQKQISTAPTAGGFYMTKYALGWPFQIPFEWLFWRSSVVGFVVCVVYDLLFGIPTPFMKEIPPGTPAHFFFGNSGGSPHHLWQYQDGWNVPNMSGARRWVD
ncbi:hypothetical protein STCU_00105 [Strigomonas culicis]|uniref:Uncharacterized protein n=1 Tax=Strigomonas culicis TaxID=28005 RepID=S9V277_9TRYP|nr:hypothetical protein STCU_00105 [Strigomonas culicis]|eukprot:EPY37192.1 hypothetical protein STCU_00105 [Strigomonas culicis]